MNKLSTRYKAALLLFWQIFIVEAFPKAVDLDISGEHFNEIISVRGRSAITVNVSHRGQL